MFSDLPLSEYDNLPKTPEAPTMKIVSTEVEARGMGGKKCWIAMHKRVTEVAGKLHNYFFVTRGDVVVPASEKKPDAVVAIGFVGEGDDMKMVLTDEYRLPVDCREIGSVAGLIDKSDYDCSPALFCGRHLGDVRTAACRAAVREFYEETGLDFIPCEVSSTNLYSSAGLTNESICLVIGKASGTPSKKFLEEHEDINTLMFTRQQIIELVDNPDVPMAKHIWPFLWSIKHHGFPKL